MSRALQSSHAPSTAITTQRIPVEGADVVVHAEFGTRETFQNDAEPARRDVEAAGLDPYAIGVRNPAAVVVDVDVGDEVFAAPMAWRRGHP